MKKIVFVVAVVAVVAALLLATGVSMYNSIVRKDIAVNEKWSQVQNVLQRRADLIPNLVRTVKGYAAHEREIFEYVAAARARLAGAQTPAETMAANAEVSSALSRLLLVVENYPQLKADQTFARLMDELAGAENRIAVERMRYNEAVRTYNTAIRVFPGSVVAGFAGYRDRPFFEAEAGAKEVPKVDFGK
ncbi:MAG TPA: LemA family protein [Candidatus Deferrimicrobiaceae bacterium]|nr:LemA family protein [Candidatus Deferrimicrobiaceae bacterium]